MTGFRPDPIVCAHSGGTVHESHMVPYSSPTADGCPGHCHFIFILLYLYRLLVYMPKFL